MRRLLALLALALAAPVAAQDSFTHYTQRLVQTQVPRQLDDAARAHYVALFSAIEQERWAEAERLLAERPDGILTQVARAEFYLAAHSPRVELPALEQWLASGNDLPQAAQIARLAQRRGASATPDLPYVRELQPQPPVARRTRPATSDDGTMPDGTRAAILQRITQDDPDGALALLAGVEPQLGPEALAEWRQRIAWSYFIENRDADARALALRAADGSGAWVAEGEWTAGLAAWRLSDCEAAGGAFERAAFAAINPELRAAALYWAARAALVCRRPQDADRLLGEAAGNDDTLYGMLALEQLGRALPDRVENAAFSAQDAQRLGSIDNVRVAIALKEIGRDSLASEVLLHQARIGDPNDYAAYSRLARDLGFPQTQLRMALNAPAGTSADPAAHYPAPLIAPLGGWQVDPALAFAHILQESVFRANAVSPARAQGLMQITPITVRQHAPCVGRSAEAMDVFDPATNLALGQCNLQMLRDDPGTLGTLPRIMAAYNAGLTPIRRWHDEVRDFGDPLLYMEAIPYWETRSYVAIVMRNYWMYERQANAPSPSRHALAQNRWPMFPEAGAATHGN